MCLVNALPLYVVGVEIEELEESFGVAMCV
jgi:hypothetical protein